MPIGYDGEKYSASDAEALQMFLGTNLPHLPLSNPVPHRRPGHTTIEVDKTAQRAIEAMRGPGGTPGEEDC